jgi:hypothetical protein
MLLVTAIGGGGTEMTVESQCGLEGDRQFPYK